jgi:amino acid permease
VSSSPSDFSEFLSRDELLGGLPARRASTLLFAIESRTAQYVSRARQAMVRYRSTRSDEEQERAFLEALAQGRDLPLQPSVQDLERYAPQWAGLVPPEANLRAALARMLGEKYRLPKRSLSRLRAALGLDTAEVQAAFERLHARQLESIYTPKLSRRERMRWQQARLAQRLEELPPFWTAFALTLTETVGAGILALPIALATVGPLAGLVVIVVLGLVNVLTLAAICESIARNGNMRYGHVYFGRLVTDYLGRAGNLLLSPALLGLSIIALLATYVGLSSTLDDATGLPAALWMSLMFLAAVWMLRSETLNATVASALIVGFSSISLIVLLSLLALPHLSEDNIRHMQVPFVRGEPWDPGILELIFGVVLLAYFGHTSAGNCAGVVLRREPSGRSFIWGSMAALAVATALYSLWVLAVNGAVAPAALEGQTGTALTPLADVAGAGIYIFGSVFVVLAMGMASLHFSLSLFNQTREWLPAPGGRHGLIDRVVATRRGRLIVGLLPMTAPSRSARRSSGARSSGSWSATSRGFAAPTCRRSMRCAGVRFRPATCRRASG